MSIQEERSAIKAWWHDRLMAELRLLQSTCQADQAGQLSEVGQRNVLAQLERLVIDVAEESHCEGYQQGRREWRLWHETR